jgi:hypothetical protein
MEERRDRYQRGLDITKDDSHRFIHATWERLVTFTKK